MLILTCQVSSRAFFKRNLLRKNPQFLRFFLYNRNKASIKKGGKKMNLKEMVGIEAAGYVKDGMVVG
ncbi:hypothetical protein B5G92_15535, partial [Listeria monocytogenes]|nr:hypothetical protein [Listeria monocytogenes]